MFGATNHIALRVFDTAKEASEAGFQAEGLYAGAKALEIKCAVVVKEGTVGGNPTVDFVMEDAEGNKYVAMITGTLLKLLPI